MPMIKHEWSNPSSSAMLLRRSMRGGIKKPLAWPADLSPTESPPQTGNPLSSATFPPAKVLYNWERVPDIQSARNGGNWGSNS